MRKGLKEKKKFIGESQDRGCVRYHSYTFTCYELIRSITKGSLIGFYILFAFYKSLWVFPVLLPFLLFYIKYDRRCRNINRLRRLSVEFKSALQSISGGLSSGYSIENAVETSVAELELLFGTTGELYREFRYLGMQIRLNQRVESLFQDLALRTGSEDIESFADVLAIAKRTGGDLVQKINDAAAKIQDRIEVREEAQVVMSGKRMEQRIMNMVPPGLLWYLNVTSPGFLEVLYITLAGRMIMTGCLAVYLLAWYWGEQIVRVEL